MSRCRSEDVGVVDVGEVDVVLEVGEEEVSCKIII